MDDEAGRWMTFAELAKARGTTKRAAVMLVRRHKWRRQKDNEGNVRALVPATWAEPVTRLSDGENSGNSSGNSSGHSDHYSAPALEVLEKALVALQAAHTRELSLLQEAHDAKVASLQEVVEQARAEAQRAQDAARTTQNGLRERAESAERDLAVARHDAEAAQQAAAELRLSDGARKARGRLRRAWDGWRGR